MSTVAATTATTTTATATATPPPLPPAVADVIKQKRHCIKLLFKTNVSTHAGQQCFFQKHHLTNDASSNITEPTLTSYPRYKKFTDNFIRVPTHIKLSNKIKSVYASDWDLGMIKPVDRTKLINAFFDDQSFYELLVKYKKKNKDNTSEFAKNSDGTDIPESVRLKTNLNVIFAFFFEKGAYFYIDGKRYRINGFSSKTLDENLKTKQPDPFKHIIPTSDESSLNSEFNELALLEANQKKLIEEQQPIKGGAPPATAHDEYMKRFFNVHEKRIKAEEYRKNRADYIKEYSKTYVVYEVFIDIECLEEMNAITGYNCDEKLLKYWQLRKDFFEEKKENEILVKRNKRVVIVQFKPFIDTPKVVTTKPATKKAKGGKTRKRKSKSRLRRRHVGRRSVH